MEHIIYDPYLPKNAYISRVISPIISKPMSNYCIGVILYYQKKFNFFIKNKQKKEWIQEFEPEKNLKVGILELGALGQDLAKKLVFLAFEVYGISQTRKNIERIHNLIVDELDIFLNKINILVCKLPATIKNKGILNRDLFQKMQKVSFLINLARGHHQVNKDIIEAIEKGWLEGAFLDVFERELLPYSSEMCTNTNTFIYPHIAVITKIDVAVPQICENHKLIKENKKPLNLVNREKEY